MATLMGIEYNSVALPKRRPTICDNPVLALRNLNANDVMADDAAGEKLNEELKRFLICEKTERSANGYELNHILSRLAIFYNVQIHLLSSEGQRFKECSFPSRFDPTMEQIFLHLVRFQDNNNFHVELVQNRKQFQAFN